MPRPILITAISLGQALLGLIALSVGLTFDFPPIYPAWFATWTSVVGVAHLLSAIALWRLHWVGPILFVFFWFGAQIVGHFLLPHSVRPQLMGALLSTGMLVLYCLAVFKYRRNFISVTR